MKKIFRMASVIALACASLTYTSCTKDYTEEINSINKNVDALESKLLSEIDKLSDRVSSLDTGLNSLKTAYEAADKALQGDIDGLKSKVSANETAIKQLQATVATLATKDELAAKAGELEGKIAAIAADLAAAKEEILAKATALEQQVKDNAEALAAIQDVYAALADELRSIVFIPDLYFAGIEATEYTYATINGMDYFYTVDDNKKKVETKFEDKIKTLSNAQPSEATKFVVAAGQPIKSTPTQVAKIVNGKPSKTETIDYVYTLGQQGVAKYNLNPSNFNVEKAEWALYGMDRQYVTKGDEPTWEPVFEGISINEDGIAEVKYSIKGAETLCATVDTAASATAASKGSIGNVPVMNLVATLDSAKTVSSDYEAILVSNEAIKSLAFAQNNDWVTENTAHTCNMEGKEPKNNKELYCTVDSAIVNMPSVEVVYNNGDIDLAKLITIHMAGTTEKELTLEQLNKNYGGKFTMTFDNIVYTVGANETAESMYAKVTKEGMYTPMYVKTGKNPTSEACGTDKNDLKGISSVGRQPVILVTLWDGEQVVLAQYFKVEVVEKNIVNKPVVIPSFGDIPYICDTVELATSWHQFSDLVLETVGVTYKEFAAYEPEKGGNPADSIKLYVKEGDKYVDIVVTGKDNAGKDIKKPVNEVFGYVTYCKDSATDGVNNALVWDAEPINIAKYNEDDTQSVYVHFVDKNNAKNNVWVELTASVVKPAAYKFGKKIANEWFDDIDGEVKNTVRLNVPVPVADKTTPVKGGDVTKFSRDVNHFLQTYEPDIVLTEDSDPIYAQIASEKGSPLAKKETIAPAIAYTFSAEQPAIDGIQLYTNAEGDSLFAASYDNDGKLVTKKVGNKDVPVLDPARLIAYFGKETADVDSSSVITYKWAEGETIAKELLNKWSYKETDQAKMLYANVDVALTYGKCKIDAGEDHFHVRFVRPLDVKFDGQDVSEESAVDGFNVELVKFIAGITDWNNQAVIIDSLNKDKKPTGNMIANVIKTVDMYAYYQFSKLTLDLEHAQRDNVDADNLGEFKYMFDCKVAGKDVKGVTPKAKLSVGTADAKGVFTANTAADANVVDIKSFDSIKKVVLNYRNDEAVVEAFNIKIPVKVSYAWGTIEDNLIISIKKTADTEGK